MRCHCWNCDILRPERSGNTQTEEPVAGWVRISPVQLGKPQCSLNAWSRVYWREKEVLKGESAIAAKQSTEKVSSEIFFTILDKKNEFKRKRCREGWLGWSVEWRAAPARTGWKSFFSSVHKRGVERDNEAVDIWKRKEILGPVLAHRWLAVKPWWIDAVKIWKSC